MGGRREGVTHIADVNLCPLDTELVRSLESDERLLELTSRLEDSGKVEADLRRRASVSASRRGEENDAPR